LHDSSPYGGRLLDELLHAGVLLVDGQQRCRYASPRAYVHCGATDQAALEDGWADISAGLGLANAATLGEGDPPLQRGFDLQTPAGVRKLRSEVHAFDGGLARYIVLLRERTTRDDAYRAHVKASECHGNRHLIANLVHDAKGPLNNIHLTLALLTSTIGRMDPAIDPRGLIGRCQRYLDVMQTEEHRLSARLNDIHALTQSADAAIERIDVGELVREVDCCDTRRAYAIRRSMWTLLPAPHGRSVTLINCSSRSSHSVTASSRRRVLHRRSPCVFWPIRNRAT
jgi:signal transduction histidine kinase